MKKKKSGSGGRLNRSEIVQARLNPKIKFAAELVSRKERQTLSSLIESSLEIYLMAYKFNVVINDSDKRLSVKEILELIWNPDPVTRFVKLALLFMEDLEERESDLWVFILNTKYFWAHYQVKIIDPKGNLIKNRWEPFYDNFDGVVLEHLQEYWDAIQTKEGRKEVKIPNKIGKKIDPPPGEMTEIVEKYDTDLPFATDIMVERDRYAIWAKNVKTLLKQEYETIETPEGPKTNIKIIYPTPEEQKEMVERLYQERNECQSSSQE